MDTPCTACSDHESQDVETELMTGISFSSWDSEQKSTGHLPSMWFCWLCLSLSYCFYESVRGGIDAGIKRGELVCDGARAMAEKRSWSDCRYVSRCPKSAIQTLTSKHRNPNLHKCQDESSYRFNDVSWASK